MSWGVPQGSALGPPLWNIGYDWVLRADLPVGVFVVSYADNMLVLEQRRLHQAAAKLAFLRQNKLYVCVCVSQKSCYCSSLNVCLVDY